MGVEDKTDMSEDYNKFDEIRPFTVKTDPSLVLNEEVSPWLRPPRPSTTREAPSGTSPAGRLLHREDKVNFRSQEKIQKLGKKLEVRINFSSQENLESQEKIQKLGKFRKLAKNLEVRQFLKVSKFLEVSKIQKVSQFEKLANFKSQQNC